MASQQTKRAPSTVAMPQVDQEVIPQRVTMLLLFAYVLACLDHSADDKQFAAAVGLEFRLPEVSQTPCSSGAPLRGPLVTQDIFGASSKANAAAAELTGPNSTLGLSALCKANQSME